MARPIEKPADSQYRLHVDHFAAFTGTRIQQCVNGWSQRLAPRSVRRVNQTVSAVLDAAVLDNRIARSPCRGIRSPAIQPTDRPVVTADQLALAEVLGPNCGLMVHRGAVLGLRWGRMRRSPGRSNDFDRSTVAITERVTRGAPPTVSATEFFPAGTRITGEAVPDAARWTRAENPP
jgi:hypothetical protein